MNIAVDAMGGDKGPRVVVQGAIQASDEMGIDVTLVGDSNAISAAMKGDRERERIKVFHCKETVLMEESPMKALRSKRDSSIRVAFDLIKKGKVDAVVSAGNSGATMAAGILILGKVDGVERPALACLMPGERGDVVLLDVGGNVDCRPIHLLQFGIMADAFATCCLGMSGPRVGLLNIGQEEGKGNEQVRQAYDLFRKSPLNFIGNVEGRDVFSGHVQIVVCDGFVGNVVLKMSEGMAQTVTSRLRHEMTDSIPLRAIALLGRKFFKGFEESLDYAEYGGAPILGIKGVGVVCHGSSSSRAIKNAIKLAVNYAENRLEERLSREISGLQAGSTKERPALERVDTEI